MTAAFVAMTLTSTATQAAAVVSFGHAFRKGDVPSGYYAVTDKPNLKVVPLNTWPDGSLRIARLCGRVPLTANTPLQINFLKTLSAPAAGTLLTADSIANAAPTASIQFGSFGTVNLGPLLATPDFTFISTSEMVECHYIKKLQGDAALYAEFHVRLFVDGRMWVRAIAGNGYMETVYPGVQKDYFPTVTVGGVVVENNAGFIYHHGHGQRWDAEGWIGADPHVTPRHDTGYMVRTRMVPNYWKWGVSPGVKSTWDKVYKPGAYLGFSKGMSGTGYQDDIGLLPLWDALFISSLAAPELYRSVYAHGRAINSFGIGNAIDSVNLKPIKISAYPTWTTDGPINTGGGHGSVVCSPVSQYPVAPDAHAAAVIGSGSTFSFYNYIGANYPDPDPASFPFASPTKIGCDLATGIIYVQCSDGLKAVDPVAMTVTPVASSAFTGPWGAANGNGYTVTVDTANSAIIATFEGVTRPIMERTTFDQLNAPQMACLGKNGDMWVADTGGNRIRKISPENMAWEQAHHTSAGYLAYLLTADYYFMQACANNANTAYLSEGATHGSGVNRDLSSQNRGRAWSYRSIGQAAAITPAALASRYSDLPAWLTALADRRVATYCVGMTALGATLGYEKLFTNRLYAAEPEIGRLAGKALDGQYGAGTAPWEAHFTAAAVCHIADLEPLPSMTNLLAFRDFVAAAPVWILGGSGANEYWFGGASAYSVNIRVAAPNDDVYYAWAASDFTAANPGVIYTDTFSTSPTALVTNPGTNMLGGDSAGVPSSATTGYWGNLMPAISGSVDAGKTGADASFARLIGASNFSDIENSGFADLPTWGVVPHSYSQQPMLFTPTGSNADPEPGAPAVTITGPTLMLSASRLYAGKLVFNKYRGWGTPLSGVVASGGSDGDSPARALIDNGDVMTNELRPDVTVAPTHGTVDIAPDLSILYAGDGTPDSFTVQWYYCGAALGSPVIYTVGGAGSNTVTISCAPGTAAALGLIAVVSGSAPNGTIQAGIGSFVAVGATATITNLAPSVVTIACQAGDATMGGAGCVVINGTASIIVAPARVLMGDGRDQPDLDGTFVMREGRPTIDTDPDDNLFYGVDLAEALGVSSASLVSVTAIPGGAAACLPAFIQDTRVIAKVRVPGKVDDCTLHSVTFRAVNTLGEQSDHTIYFRMVNK